MLAHDMARSAGGEFLLRIEDIDQSRAQDEWERKIYEDLSWLGVRWSSPVRRQSERMARYAAALDALGQLGLTYPCSCRRRDIQAALSAPQEGELRFGPDGLVYPGTCRKRRLSEKQKGDAVRLNMAKALDTLTKMPTFLETGPSHAGHHKLDAKIMLRNVGDVVLARPGWGTSYHLAVTIDDAAQGISHVVRGEDLFEATSIHVLLQALLKLPTPVYHHHRLIRDESGKRLAKRDDARAISRFREDGASAEDIRKMVGLA